MIVGVAGFCILAIFSMIVREKTRDIGILKSLGASNRGVMQIFLGYGLLLGVIGAGCGTVMGLLITHYINEIEHVLYKLTGVGFTPEVYYFDQIPTKIESMTVMLVDAGAILIAVTFSVWPAVRAAWLRPVQALRFE
jgi:lipoprotein-releasing system permease protein